MTQAIACVNENLIYIQYQLSQLGTGLAGGGGGGTGTNPDPVTCTQLTGLILTVNTFLGAIAQAIAGAAAGGGAPVDLSHIIASLAQMALALQSYPPIWNAIADALGAKLDNIATAAGKGTDVSGIVKQLETIAGQGDVDQPIFQALQQQGLLTPADLQTLQGIKWSDAISYITSSAPFRTFMKGLAVMGTDAESIASWLKATLTPAGNWAEKKIVGAAVLERNAIQDVIEPILQTVTGALKPADGFRPTLGVINVNPDTVLADVTAVGINLFIMCAIVGLVSEGAGERLAEISEVATGVLGFEELKEVQIGPLVEHGIAAIAEMQAKATFQQELPATAAMQGWVAQGLMTAARAKALSLFNGTPDEIYPIQQAASYRGLNPRQILRLIETDIFSQTDIADELTFSGMRGVSQGRMLQAAPYLATASERSSLRSTLESAYAAGLLSDADLESRVIAIESNTDLANLVVSRARLQKLIAETKALETEYTSLFVGGLLDDATYRDYLAALGLQPDMVNSIAGRAEARANVTLHRKELAAAAQAARQLQKAIDQTALKNYAAGSIDAAALTAALLASGIPATQAAAMTDLAVLRRNGSLRWVYGQQLLPQAATLLHQRVADLTDQRKRLQITDPQYVAALKALGVGDRWVNALQAQADAMISPKTSAFPITVQTG